MTAGLIALPESRVEGANVVPPQVVPPTTPPAGNPAAPVTPEPAKPQTPADIAPNVKPFFDGAFDGEDGRFDADFLDKNPHVKRMGDAYSKLSSEAASLKEKLTKAQVDKGYLPDFDKEWFNAVSGELAEKGELSPEMIKKVEALGMPQREIQRFIKLDTAARAAQRETFQKLAGGPEMHEAINSWAKENLSADTIMHLNEQMHYGDPIEQEIAMKTLVERFQKAMNVTAGFGPTSQRPTSLERNGTPAGGDVYPDNSVGEEMHRQDMLRIQEMRWSRKYTEPEIRAAENRLTDKAMRSFKTAR